MIWLWICTYFWLFHIRCFGMNITPIWHDRIFICFMYVDLIFPHAFCFEHFGFDIWVLKNTHHAMILTTNVYFWKIYNIHNHTWTFIWMNFFKLGWQQWIYCRIADNHIILCISWLFEYTTYWVTNEAVMKFLGGDLQ